MRGAQPSMSLWHGCLRHTKQTFANGGSARAALGMVLVSLTRMYRLQHINWGSAVPAVACRPRILLDPCPLHLWSQLA